MDWLKSELPSFKSFCDAWANTASVVGLLVSLVGFIITISSVMTAKKAARKAEAAANRARRRILTYEAVEDCSLASTLIEEIKGLHRSGEWKTALMRYAQLRRLFVSLLNQDSRLNERLRTDLKNAFEGVMAIEKRVERTVSSGKPAPDVAKVNDGLSTHINTLHETAIALKTEIGDPYVGE